MPTRMPQRMKTAPKMVMQRRRGLAEHGKGGIALGEDDAEGDSDGMPMR